MSWHHPNSRGLLEYKYQVLIINNICYMYNLYYFIIIACVCTYNLFPDCIHWEHDLIRAEEWECGHPGVISHVVAPLEMPYPISLSHTLSILLTLLTAEIPMVNFNFHFSMLILRYTSNYPCVNEAKFKLCTSNSQGQAEVLIWCFLLLCWA